MRQIPRVLAELAGLSVDALPDALIARLVTTAPQDDVALIAVRPKA
jgi:hypothetical protein